MPRRIYSKLKLIIMYPRRSTRGIAGKGIAAVIGPLRYSSLPDKVTIIWINCPPYPIFRSGTHASAHDVVMNSVTATVISRAAARVSFNDDSRERVINIS